MCVVKPSSSILLQHQFFDLSRDSFILLQHHFCHTKAIHFHERATSVPIPTRGHACPRRLPRTPAAALLPRKVLQPPGARRPRLPPAGRTPAQAHDARTRLHWAADECHGGPRQARARGGRRHPARDLQVRRAPRRRLATPGIQRRHARVRAVPPTVAHRGHQHRGRGRHRRRPPTCSHVSSWPRAVVSRAAVRLCSRAIKETSEPFTSACVNDHTPFPRIRHRLFYLSLLHTTHHTARYTPKLPLGSHRDESETVQVF